jgi:hypothetical protein
VLCPEPSVPVLQAARRPSGQDHGLFDQPEARQPTARQPARSWAVRCRALAPVIGLDDRFGLAGPRGQFGARAHFNLQPTARQSRVTPASGIA